MRLAVVVISRNTQPQPSRLHPGVQPGGAVRFTDSVEAALNVFRALKREISLIFAGGIGIMSEFRRLCAV
jgi:hypothetical protein